MWRPSGRRRRWGWWCRSRRSGEYLYDVDLYKAMTPANTVLFFARVVNMVRLESGHTVALDAELPDQPGATLDEAFAHSEAAVEASASHLKGRAGHEQ